MRRGRQPRPEEDHETREEVRSRLVNLSPEELRKRKAQLERECPGITEYWILVREFLGEDPARNHED